MTVSYQHEFARDALDDIALLSGYSVPIPLPLPDGSIPDVARTTAGCNGVFLGDAKHTEVPTDRETISRIRKYMTWLRLLKTEVYRKSFFAIATTDSLYAMAWKARLYSIGYDVGLSGFSVLYKTLSPDLCIVWLAADRDTQLTPQLTHI